MGVPLAAKRMARALPPGLMLTACFVAVVASGAGGEREQSVMLSLLLKMQCDVEIQGFTAQTAPFFSAWQRDNQEIIDRLETDPAFLQRKQTLRQLLPTLSDKTKAGIRKDCATITRHCSRSSISKAVATQPVSG